MTANQIRKLKAEIAEYSEELKRLRKFQFEVGELFDDMQGTEIEWQFISIIQRLAQEAKNAQ